MGIVLLGNTFNKLLDLIYPPRCGICNGVMARGGPEWFCEECINNLDYIEKPACIKCGRTVENENTACKFCQYRHFDFERNVSLFTYEGDIRRAVHRFKYRNNPRMGIGFGKLMADVFEREFAGLVDVLVPVPMHRAKQRRRGFNQAAVLSREISKNTGVPTDGAWLVRRKNTTPQSDLKAEERERNVSGAFYADSNARSYDGARVLLVDDILTTGSTAQACAKTLLENGAEAVYVLTLTVTK